MTKVLGRELALWAVGAERRSVVGGAASVRYAPMTMVNTARQVEVAYAVPDQDERWELEEEDTVPESPLHDAIIRLLVEILLAWNARAGSTGQVGRNIALRWNARAPKQGVDPDVYLVDPAPPEGQQATSLCTWKPGHHPPRIAIEVVSEGTAENYYVDGPDRYAASGTRELWVFDPLLVGPAAHGGPMTLQVWRRDASGSFRRIYAGEGPARSEELGAWVVVTDDGQRLRIADDAEGVSRWPTEAEAERAAKEAAEAEVERLRAELAQLRADMTKR